MFWTDLGDVLLSKIEVARMDGTLRKTLVGNSVVWPSSLAVDFPARRLYWADIKTQTIETVRLDGTERNVVRKFISG